MSKYEGSFEELRSLFLKKKNLIHYKYAYV